MPSPTNTTHEPDIETVFFLGGHDLEMIVIRELLEQVGAEFHDLGLAWGSKASAYQSEIDATIRDGKRPVLIELFSDLPAATIERCQIIDHHGELAGSQAPTSLEQIYRLLGTRARAWTRWQALVAANDRGHIAAMRQLEPPASDADIRQVRTADLKAQGAKENELTDARSAAQGAQTLADGRLTVVETVIRGGLIAEMLEPCWGGAGYKNLLVIGPEQFAFFGEGALVQRLADASPPAPDAWYGGSLPDSGYWGARSAKLHFDPLSMLQSALAAE